jgi:hypothetical protein
VYLKPLIGGQMTFEELNSKCFRKTGNENLWHEKLDGKMFSI